MNRAAILCPIVMTTLLLLIVPSCAKPIFELSGLTISRQEVRCGESTTISVDISNSGGAEGTYHLILKIDGVQIDDENVTVGPGVTRSASFTVCREEAGSYTVKVDGLTTTLVVLRRAEFQMDKLIVSPTEVLAGRLAMVTVDVTNIGEVDGDCEVTLRVNGRVLETNNVTIAAESNRTVTFKLLEDKGGTYNVSVNGLSGTLTVVMPPERPRPAMEGVIYSNAEHGFSVEYPKAKDWTLERRKGVVVTFGGPFLPESGFDVMIDIVVYVVQLPKEATLEWFVKTHEAAVRSGVANYNRVDQYDATIAGLPAVVQTITGTLKANGEDVLTKSAVARFVKDELGYVIIYRAPEEFHDEYVDCFDLVLSTFEFD